jgi:hypothetical protein
MDEDMARLKSLLEQGKTTAEGQPRRLEEMTGNEPATTPKPAKRARTRK